MTRRVKKSGGGYLKGPAGGGVRVPDGPGGGVAPTPPPTNPSVLQQSDFIYKGMFSVGEDTFVGGVMQRKGYARGNLTGRRVNGVLRLFITGSHADEWRSPIYEMTPPVESTWAMSYVNSPPSMSLVKDWSGGVRGDAAPLFPNGKPVFTPDGRLLKGLLWDPVLNGVWYSYIAVYNVAPTHDPSIGFCHINDATGVVTGYGPWRHKEISPRTGGYGLYIPDAWKSQFGNRNLAFGAETAVRGVLGFSLHPTERPANYATLPFDTAPQVQNVTNGPTQPTPHWSLNGSPAIMNGYGQDYQRKANFKNCGWADANPPQDNPLTLRMSPALAGNPAYIYDPNGNGGTLGRCNMDAIDSISSSVFIDTGTKYGVLFFGIMVWPSDTSPDPHTWYGPTNNAAGGQTGCSHGQIAYTGGTGTGYYASSFLPIWWIYDPAALSNAYNGITNPATLAPSSEFSARSMHGAANEGHFSSPTRWYCTGAYFDPETKYLYLHEDEGVGWSQGEKRGMIHVFQVGG